MSVHKTVKIKERKTDLCFKDEILVKFFCPDSNSSETYPRT